MHDSELLNFLNTLVDTKHTKKIIKAINESNNAE